MTDPRTLTAQLAAIAERDGLIWNPGAHEEDLARLEEALEVRLPVEYREALQWHDGTDDREFCSVDEALEIAEELLEICEELDEGEPATYNIEPGTGRAQDGDFVRGWVPFYDYGTGAFDLVDCAPGPNGTHGQIIHYDPDGSNGITHRSMSEWVADRSS